jgi:hypothetical protein
MSSPYGFLHREVGGEQRAGRLGRLSPRVAFLFSTHHAMVTMNGESDVAT